MPRRRRPMKAPPTKERIEQLRALPTLSLDEAGELAGVHPHTVALWYAQGCPRPGPGRRIPTQLFLDWLEQRGRDEEPRSSFLGRKESL